MAFNIADVVEAVVDAVPDLRALTCAGRHWTFRELDEHANRAAHMFAAAGIGAGDKRRAGAAQHYAAAGYPGVDAADRLG